MIKTVLNEIKKAPGLFEDLVKLQQENTKQKETIRFLEWLVDRFKPDALPADQSAILVKSIKDKAQEFCLDNPRLLGAELVIETAMFIGASVALGSEVKG